MKRCFAFLFCFVWLGGFAHAGQLTEAQFTAKFVKFLQSAQPGIDVEVKGRLQLTIKPPGGVEANVFLDNAYRNYTSDPDKLGDVIKIYASQALEIKDAKGHILDRTRIVPLIKDRSWIDEIRQSIITKSGKDDFQILYDDFNGDLVIVYAEDAGDHFTYPTQKQLEEAGIPREGLRELAVANLRRIVPKCKFRRFEDVLRIKAEDGYDTSVLLFTEMWASLAGGGEIVVALPARDLLLWVRAADAKGVASFAKIAADVRRTSAYALTDRLFVFRDGRFERYN